MPLTQASIDNILNYLDPHLDTLKTGFPTSTRPNEPALTKDQKRQKIEATLQKDPGIFLTKWGSVILYPRPAEGKVSTLESEASLMESNDYEVQYQLTKLYQQLHQLSEHAAFKASRISSTNNRSADMDIDAQASIPTVSPTEPASSTRKSNAYIAEEDRKPDPAQNDLFTRSTVSQNTRRNRRLNYLLRHLAPPDSSDPQGMHTSSHSVIHDSVSRHASGGGSGSSGDAGTMRSQSSKQHPALASILSISGSMSNLSFSESTYFSDAEMEARAPELYQQYIGRFMDNDDNDDEVDDEDDASSDTVEDDHGGKVSDSKQIIGTEDADDEGDEIRRTRRPKQSSEPFGKDVGLVDRILWNIDHPTRKQQNIERERREAEISRQQMQQRQPESPSNEPVPFTRRADVKAAVNQASESEFEEEFDTESETEDTDMADRDDRKGPLKDIIVDDDEILVKTSVTPPIPPDPIPGITSSTFASAAMTLEQPEERALFAHVDNGDDLDSDDDKEMDQATAERKEDQNALRREFVLLMKQRFLDGLDKDFDYSLVDYDENLDDLEQETHDQEDQWFDAEEEDDDDMDGTSKSAKDQGVRVRSDLSSWSAFDERVKAWEGSAQNGAGEYDY
ncbi:hypothetical protein EDD11_002851 [Mortierella claussenii]|nr:hypothetical protein EDD11_002851 [Mortierella claussenii]